jgi:hypothetical protein
VTLVDRALGVALATAVVAGVVALSNAALPAPPSAGAVLRVTFSASPERVETCRAASAEDLARLPAHMRQPLVCEGTTASYRLAVRVGGRLLAERVVRAGGMRHDRRIFVLEEIPVPGVEADVDLRFDRIEAGDGRGRTPDAGARPRTAPVQVRDAVPPRLAYEGRLAFRPGRAIVVTYDPRRQALIAMR